MTRENVEVGVVMKDGRIGANGDGAAADRREGAPPLGRCRGPDRAGMIGPSASPSLPVSR